MWFLGGWPYWVRISMTSLEGSSLPFFLKSLATL